MKIKDIISKVWNSKDSFQGGGLILFETTHEAMKCEKIMRSENICVKLVAPPVDMRIGCDLAVEFDIIEKLMVERFLSENEIQFLDVKKIEDGSQKPVNLVDITEYNDYIMVRAGNMKITFNTDSGIIVNISGGGCPDVPYLYHKLVDKHLEEAPRPGDLGYTLCALMLDRAFSECLAIREAL